MSGDGWLERWRKTQYSIISNKHKVWLLCTSQVKYFQAWLAGRRLQGGPRTCCRYYFSQLVWEHVCFSQKSWRRWIGKERFRLLCLLCCPFNRVKWWMDGGMVQHDKTWHEPGLVCACRSCFVALFNSDQPHQSRWPAGMSSARWPVGPSWLVWQRLVAFLILMLLRTHTPEHACCVWFIAGCVLFVHSRTSYIWYMSVSISTWAHTALSTLILLNHILFSCICVCVSSDNPPNFSVKKRSFDEG